MGYICKTIEAAKICGVSKPHFTHLAKRWGIKPIVIPGKQDHFWTEEAVERWTLLKVDHDRIVANGDHVAQKGKETCSRRWDRPIGHKGADTRKRALTLAEAFGE